MTARITRLDAASLSKVFDRVTVDALLNMARITGPDASGPTIPELGVQNQEIFVVIDTIRDAVEAAQGNIQSIELYPPVSDQDLSLYAGPLITPRSEEVQSVQTLITEVRQLAEAVAQFQQHITTEVRQIADQQIVNANLINEIRQGTML